MSVAVVDTNSEAIFQHPDEGRLGFIDSLDEPPLPHLALSAGPHSCLGAPLARIVLARFVEHLIDHLPNLRWDPDRSCSKISGWAQRMAVSLPVVWDSA